MITFLCFYLGGFAAFSTVCISEFSGRDDVEHPAFWDWPIVLVFLFVAWPLYWLMIVGRAEKTP